MILALAGNPNCGKTTLFQRAYGGERAHGQLPGRDRHAQRPAYAAHGRTMTLVDLPGVYALRPFSDEERVTRSVSARR